MNPKRTPRIAFLSIVICAVLSPEGLAKAPDWLRQAQRITPPKQSEETQAITLLDETKIVVTDAAEIRTRSRRAFRVLSSEATDLAWVVLPFDGETKVSGLRDCK